MAPQNSGAASLTQTIRRSSTNASRHAGASQSRAALNWPAWRAISETPASRTELDAARSIVGGRGERPAAAPTTKCFAEGRFSRPRFMPHVAAEGSK